jgi:hypothetical protein
MLVSHGEAMAEASCGRSTVHAPGEYAGSAAGTRGSVGSQASSERVTEAWAEEPGDKRSETAAAVGRTRGGNEGASAAAQASDCVVLQRKTQGEARVHVLESTVRVGAWSSL